MITRCYQRYIRKQNNASSMTVMKTLPCSYQMLPKIYKEIRKQNNAWPFLKYGCKKLPSVTIDMGVGVTNANYLGVTSCYQCHIGGNKF